MKKQLITPDIRIVRIDSQDIIVTSPSPRYEPQNEFSEEEYVTTPARRGIFD